MWELPEKILSSLKEMDEVKKMGFLSPEKEEIHKKLISDLLYRFLDNLIVKVDDILNINPNLEIKEILRLLAENIVRFLDAKSASIRIYDPETDQMVASGSFMHDESIRKPAIPLGDTIFDEVFRTRKSYPVPNIMKERLYKDKEIVERLGVHSMLAVPFRVEPFFPRDRETLGVIQIYYEEPDRDFDRVEIRIAEMMANRVSFVLAGKKILDLYRLNEKKEMIVEKIFYRLGAQEGIKMKDAFNRVIPELSDIMQIQSCALFSVVDDGRAVLLEAGYPEKEGYHGIGKKFSIKDERYFDLIINQTGVEQESPYEKIDRSYVLIIDPQNSQLMTDNLRRFARDHNINSILYVPLRVDGEVKYILSFDALEKRSTFTDEEIEILIFLGRELMKAHRMEMLDDILHDFKNPAIATAGFARRLRNLLDKGSYDERKDEIDKSLDILLKETFRLQELALSIYDVGKESVMDLTEKLLQRFVINEEAIKEQLRQNIRLIKKELEPNLMIKGHPLRLERILDNLLNNATNAIPEMGGELSIRTFRDPPWACAEISNTGVMADEDREKLLMGDGRGRGLNITNRLIRMMRGRIEVFTFKNHTTVLIKFPLYDEGIEGSRVDEKG